MKLKILCPQWGHEHLDLEAFFVKVKSAGYDGVDMPIPENSIVRSRLIRLLDEYGLSIVAHQHQANGASIGAFCKSFQYYLNIALECNPILINSHSGRDYFTLDEQLLVIDTAQNFSAEKNSKVAHETHRGRIGFGPGNAKQVFDARPAMQITADFSHWVCVTESFLENFQEVLEEGIKRSAHIHARVGFIEGPQVPNPANPYWQKETAFFLQLWKRILDMQQTAGTGVFTATPEFGPPPYMWTNAEDNKPVANQWEVNVYMKDLLRQTFNEY